MDRPTIERPLPHECVPGNSHSTSIDGQMYDVYKLIRASEAIPLSHRPASALFLQAIKICGWSDLDDRRTSVREVLKAILRANPDALDWDAAMQTHPRLAEHIARIRDADCHYPILLSPTGDILDGSHRIAKGFLERRETLPVRQFASVPESALLRTD